MDKHVTRTGANGAGYARASSIRFWGGLWVAIGAGGVVITSVLYAIAPPLAALPVANVPVPEALQAAITGQGWMLAAGSVGIFADVAFAAGALLLLTDHVRSDDGLAASGWAWIAITNLIFVVVDALVSRVLGPVAALGSSLPAFAGFKHLFDLLFILGTFAFGVGCVTLLAGEMRADVAVLPRAGSALGIVVGAVGLVSALGYFAGIALAPAIGITIGAGSLLFMAYGVLIARSALRGRAGQPATRAELRPLVNAPGG